MLARWTKKVSAQCSASVHLLCILLCLQSFLSILCAMKWGTFLFFAGWVLIMTIFVIFCVPETKVIREWTCASHHTLGWLHGIACGSMAKAPALQPLTAVAAL